MKLKKSAMFSDIHWGRKNNSEVHNKDCTNFIEWFCEQVKADTEIDSIIFLGDWHEHRSSINGLTLTYSYKGAKLLDALGLPIYFVVGNHDLYYRNNRGVFTTIPFDSLKNFIVVNDTPLVLPENDAVIFPYLFDEEYDTILPKYKQYGNFFGHFSFKGFIVTGESRTLDRGPEHTALAKQKRIFSGHFHKRQLKDNVVYIGNAFPADFSDANDNERGMAIYNHETDELSFKDWAQCPTYIKTTLSKIGESPKAVLRPNSRVRCTVDVSLTYEEANELKEILMRKYKLREISLEEPNDLQDALVGTEATLEGMELESTENIVIELLGQIKSEKIKTEKLIDIFKGLS